MIRGKQDNFIVVCVYISKNKIFSIFFLFFFSHYFIFAEIREFVDHNHAWT